VNARRSQIDHDFDSWVGEEPVGFQSTDMPQPRSLSADLEVLVGDSDELQIVEHRHAGDILIGDVADPEQTDVHTSVTC